MRKESALRHLMVKRILVGTINIHSYVVPETYVITSRLVTAWQRIALQLTPIIATKGFHALYCRSLYLTKTKIPWLALAQDPPKFDASFVKLKRCLEQREAAEAIKAIHTLLLTFVELLATLIGASLT